MEIIRFNETAVSKAQSMKDFYERIGIGERFEENPIDVRLIWMNSFQNEELGKAFKKNARKNRSLKGLSQAYLDQITSMDWLNYSPVSDDAIPRGELWILSNEEAKERRSNFAKIFQGELT